MRPQLPNTWRETPLVHLISPLEDFLKRSASQGIVLLIVTGIAVVLANTALGHAYDEFLHTPIGLSIGSFELQKSLMHLINDGLMAIFFLLIGLEIKREILVGELSDLRAALLPIGSAIGGAVVPALIYVAINTQNGNINGWGIPMATDIAFALGVLALLGNRIPGSLKVFVTALAIIDDLIAILVIAIFYSKGINVGALGIGFGILALLVLANIVGIRSLIVYLGLGVLVWFAFLQSGIHATIAGVLVALTIPARGSLDATVLQKRIQSILGRFEGEASQSEEEREASLLALEEILEEAQSPLQRLEHSLRDVSAFIIMPVFAFANAGVVLSPEKLTGDLLPVTIGIVVALVIGKPLGILAASWLMIRSGIASLPGQVTWRQMTGVACLAGIGFTMSLFVASLAFSDAFALDHAKIGILIASVLAGGLGYMFLRRK
ncbi:MAG: Na+/H+ antiporter NhaA [Anaerolineaceae bacterium]|nr:Na+/H+ antiporter NhaA [Anaerolineaceae bacterium]